MLRWNPLRMTVRERGTVFFRTRLKTIEDRAALTPLLQERPYPLAEIVRRVVRIRVRCQHSDDEKEMALLRGEYKFYTGKGVHMRDAETADIVAMLSCAGYFGFWDNVLVEKLLEQLAGRIDELSAVELCQLAQDLPRIDRARGPLLRAVLRLLCANRAERLSDELAFEDHLDLVANAVGIHCPAVFVRNLLLLIEPRVDDLKAPQIESVLDALLVLKQLSPADLKTVPAAAASETTTSSHHHQVPFAARMTKRLREMFLDNIREDNKERRRVDEDEYLDTDDEELAPATVAHVFEQLAVLGAMDVFSARAFREWFHRKRLEQLSCDALVGLLRRHAQLFGPDKDLFGMLLLTGAHLRETIATLESTEIVRAIELVAVARPGAAPCGADDQDLMRLLDELFDHLIALREANVGVWPAPTAMSILTSIVMVLEPAWLHHHPSAAVNNKSEDDAEVGRIRRFSQRPMLNAVVKSLCAAVVSAAPSMDAGECCAFLALSVRLAPYVLDASVSAVARRARDAIDEMTDGEVHDLITLLAASGGGSGGTTSRISENKSVCDLLVPALKENELARVRAAM